MGSEACAAESLLLARRMKVESVASVDLRYRRPRAGDAWAAHAARPRRGPLFVVVGIRRPTPHRSVPAYRATSLRVAETSPGTRRGPADRPSAAAPGTLRQSALPISGAAGPGRHTS